MTALRPWYERMPGRFEAEREQMAREQPAMRFDETLPYGGWRGTLAGEGVDVLLEYSRHHPRVPPRVREVDAAGVETNAIRTVHRYADGGVCLYTHDQGSEAWHRSYTAADALSRLGTLLGDVDAGRELPVYTSAPSPIPGMGGPGIGFVPASLARHLRLRSSERAAWGTFSGRVSLREPAATEVVFTIDSLTLPGHKRETTPTEGEALILDAIGGEAGGGIVIFLTRPLSRLFDPHASSFDLENIVRDQLGPKSDAPIGRAGLMLITWREDMGDARTHRMALFIPRMKFPLLPIALPMFALLHLPLHILDAERAARPREGVVGRCDETWAKVRVIIVGLGSLGSVVAVELAKSGVRNFTLFDPERLEPANLVRHVGEARDVGRRKVDIVNDRILGHNPSAQVLPIATHAPDGQYDEQSRFFLDAIDRPHTLLIVATAEHHAEDALNAEAVERGVPAIYASVLGPAAHGRVYRVLPGRTPCHECVVEAARRRLPQMPRYEEAQAPVDLPADRYRAPSMPGVSLDITHVALTATRMALRTLAELHPALTYPGRTRDHVLVTNHGGWVFEGDETLRTVELDRLEDCPVCGDIPSNEESALRD